MAIAIIGGTGVGQFPLEGESATEHVTTRWGSVELTVGQVAGKTVYFLARHGSGHKLVPHRINYRANIAALAAVGVRAILATTAVGSLRPDWGPGTLVVLNDLIDFCLTRQGKTFFDSAPVHTDVTYPYSAALRKVLLTAAQAQGIACFSEGTYLCADGPRYETAAEVRLFASWGADVVGMTGVPETILAREASMHYAGVSLVTNLGAGIGGSEISHQAVEAVMAETGKKVRELFMATIGLLETEQLPPIGPGVSIQ